MITRRYCVAAALIGVAALTWGVLTACERNSEQRTPSTTTKPGTSQPTTAGARGLPPPTRPSTLPTPTTRPAVSSTQAVAPTTQAAHVGPQVYYEALSLNFGPVWQYGVAVATVSVVNVGDQPLVVTPAAHDCLVVDPAGWTVLGNPILPSNSVQVLVPIDTVTHTGPVDCTVTLSTNDPNQPEIKFPVHGSIQPFVDLQPGPRVDFGTIPADTPRTASMEFVGQFPGKMQPKLEAWDRGRYDVTIEPIVEGHSYRVVVMTKPPLPPGPTTTTLDIDPQMTNLARARIHLTVAADVSPAKPAQP